jgi:glycosyltransferase involved in cell wall biosynthesis
LKKIIHWSFLYYPHLGGLSTYIDSFVNNTPEFKHVIVTNRIPNTKIAEKYSDNIVIRRFNPTDIYHFPTQKMRKRYSILYGAYCEIIRTLNQKRYFRNSDFDILHVHETNKNLVSLDIALKSDIFAKLSHRLYDLGKIKTPVIMTKHFLTVENHHHPKLIEWDYKFTSQFDNIICVDRRIYDVLNEYFESKNQQKNLWFIPNSIDLNKFSYFEPVYQDRLKVGIAGRLASETGQHFIYKFLKQIPDFVEIYWACSENEQKIEELRAKFENSNVHIYSNVKYEDMPKFYSNIDVLLNPIKFEYNVSRVTLESMACGRPVIMFPGYRYPLVNGKNGFIVNNDVTDVISLLSDLADNRGKLNNIGKESRFCIKDEYSTEIVIPKIKKVYDIIEEIN